ncbi:hypothetical protein PsorP6_008271 [Peronosclerospora sorghi]|uniref:Uncharacterized protein n=1 Tax=Peronosclerospora sorghi TaxID=230839 RepID=A0ACC0W6X3_9STRA|nr:hypothetical protein PsorP6_008271 [Peronosclerospora sorghi]
MNSLLQGLKFARRSENDDKSKKKIKKKEKKEKKEKKQYRKHKRKRSDEMNKKEDDENASKSRLAHDEWMSMSFETFNSVSKASSEKALEMEYESKKQKRHEEVDAGMREPVTGLIYGLYDPKLPDTNQNLVGIDQLKDESGDDMSIIGDLGASWRAKMLQRAQEPAESIGAKLETVVSERFGNVRDLVQRASGSPNENAQLHNKRDEVSECQTLSKRRDPTDKNVLATYSKRVQRTVMPTDGESYVKRKRDEKEERINYNSLPDFEDTPSDSQASDRGKSSKRRVNHQYSPSPSGSQEKMIQYTKGSNKHAQSMSFSAGKEHNKASPPLEATPAAKIEGKKRQAFLYGQQSGHFNENEAFAAELVDANKEDRKAALNKLAARALRAQMMGNTTLFRKLREELNELEATVEQEKRATEVPHYEAVNGALPPLEKEDLRLGSRKGKKKLRDDLDKSGWSASMSLNELVREERIARADDTMDLMHARNILRLGSRYKGLEGHTRTFSSGFDEEDQVDLNLVLAPKRTRRAEFERERASAAHETKKWDERMHKCQLCMKSLVFPKHLLLSLGESTYLALAKRPRLHPAHCLIVPIEHTCSLVQAEEQVMVEITRFQDALARLCAKRYGKSIVFLEQTSAPARKRHTVMECIPIDAKLALDLPLYLKQELTLADEEWSTHKPIVETSKGSIQRHIPPSFPYFHMEWQSPTTRRGYAHVIENETKFPRDFGTAVVAGLLEVTPSNFGRRESKKSAVDEDKRDMVTFVKDWEPFDWTRQLDGGEITPKSRQM